MSAPATRAGPSPVVSVIVPVYNTSALVGAAIESLKAQSFADFEALVVDDGSTDGSGAAALSAIGGDRRFRLIQRENGGLSAARNTALDAANGEFLAFLDSDDEYAPDFLGALVDALGDSGADWAASAVLLLSGERTEPHSAIHGTRHPATEAPWETMPLDDWREIVRHWPSAWNKLYRRSVVGDLRFPEGLYYEDHPWFQALAARCATFAYVPRPLYRHRRGRAGQITSDGSEKVFDIFSVLKLSTEIIGSSAKPGAFEGLAMLATRVIHERAAIVADPARRARFAAESRKFLASNGLTWTPEWDPGIARAWALAMEGDVPLTVVVAADAPSKGLARTLASLARQWLRDLEVLVVPSGPVSAADAGLHDAIRKVPTASLLAAGPGGLSAARNRGLGAAQGRFVAFLDAGDSMAPGGYWTLVEGMLRETADLGLCRFRQDGRADRLHSGTHDARMPFGAAPVPLPPPGARQPDWLSQIAGTARPLLPDRALRLHALPSAKIFRTEFLRDRAITFPDEPLASWDVTFRAALAASRVLSFPNAPVALSTARADRRLWRAPRRVADIEAALLRLAPVLDPVLPRADWLPVLVARAVWEKVNFADFATPADRDTFLVEAAEMARRAGPIDSTDGFDPHIGPRVRALFGAVAAPGHSA
ncbi:MAG: glycosyltransferase [Pseudomonadota bacterium]